MLSIEECRRILGQPQLTDKEVADIRATLYAFAHSFIDRYVDDQQADRSRRPAARDERSGKPKNECMPRGEGA